MNAGIRNCHLLEAIASEFHYPLPTEESGRECIV
jgi:hypothetical protein